MWLTSTCPATSEPFLLLDTETKWPAWPQYRQIFAWRSQSGASKLHQFRPLLLLPSCCSAAVVEEMVAAIAPKIPLSPSLDAKIHSGGQLDHSFQ